MNQSEPTPCPVPPSPGGPTRRASERGFGRLTTAALLLLLVIAALFVARMLRAPELGAYPVQSGPMVQSVVATGRVLNPVRVQIGADLTGTVVERLVQEGDRFAAGELLLRLNDEPLQARRATLLAQIAQVHQQRLPEAELRRAESATRLRQSEREASRQRDLHSRGLVPTEMRERAEEEFEIRRIDDRLAQLQVQSWSDQGAELAVLRQRLAELDAEIQRTRILSPAAGQVLTRAVEVGDVVQPGRVLFELAIDGPTEIIAAVEEKNLGILQLGQPAIVAADALPDQAFDAVVHFIAPAVDAQRGTIDVRLRVSSAPDFLRQDMTVSIDIETARRESTLAIPRDALGATTGNESEVLVVVDGLVRVQRVRTGLQGRVLVEVLSGLTAGDFVLPADTAIDEGSKVRVQAMQIPGDDAPKNRESPLGAMRS